MELRPPPRPVDHPSQDRWLRPLLVAQLTGLVVLALLVWMRASGPPGAGRDPEQLREVATKLLAAGALDQAAEGFERYLAVAEEPSARRIANRRAPIARVGHAISGRSRPASSCPARIRIGAARAQEAEWRIESWE